MDENNLIIPLEEVKRYLRVDFDDDDNLIIGTIKAAESYIKSGTSPNLDLKDEKVKELLLIVISDMYDLRGMSDKLSNNVRMLVNDLMMQIRIEGGNNVQTSDTN